jgi:hypothetical protein
MEKIGLTGRGELFTYDHEDSGIIEPFNWFMSDGYVAKSVWVSLNKFKQVYMHHCIIGHPQKGFVVDHRNRVGSNNTRSNLRFVTVSQNHVNRMKVPNQTGFRGVKFLKGRVLKKPYQARIKINKKYIYLGYFETPEEAHQAYLSKRSEHYGDFYIHPQL